MTDYKKYISAARRCVPTPEALVRKDGICEFGTFAGEFKDMDLIRARKPTRAPQFMNRLKLTLWEATEIHLKEGILLTSVCDMGLFGKILCVFYDKRTHDVYGWSDNLKSRDAFIAPNLIGGTVAEAKTAADSVRFVNDLDKGEYTVCGHHEGRSGSIEYSFICRRLSLPSVVSIPFGENRPLYSQKDFLRAEGYLTVNGEKMASDGDSVAILDDHRGYYPRRAHYDWVTTLGKPDGEYFAFNLTENQSTDSEKYNENLIWFKDSVSLLPPVTFRRDKDSGRCDGSNIWYVTDEHDMVNLTFQVKNMYPTLLHAGIVSIDYYLAYGSLSGYLRDEEGKKYILDGLVGMGEDKTLLF